MGFEGTRVFNDFTRCIYILPSLADLWASYEDETLEALESKGLCSLSLALPLSLCVENRGFRESTAGQSGPQEPRPGETLQLVRKESSGTALDAS